MGSDVRFQRVTLRRTRPDQSVISVLDDVSFSIPGSARTIVIGPSGAGKTSLLRLINRLDDPDTGSIYLGGVNIQTIAAPELRRRVGIVFQQPRLFDATVFENLNRPLALARRSLLTDSEAVVLLRRMDLPDAILGSHSRELSVGQQQRVAIARSLVLNPEVMLLDEPTSALDQRSAAVILDLLIDLNQTLGLTMLMVTHTVEHAHTFGDLALGLKNGNVMVDDDIGLVSNWALEAETEAGSQ